MITVRGQKYFDVKEVSIEFEKATGQEYTEQRVRHLIHKGALGAHKIPGRRGYFCTPEQVSTCIEEELAPQLVIPKCG